jgi:Delta24-sterol reductase
MDHHNCAVSEIASQVRQFYESKTPFRIYHGSTNSTRVRHYQRDELIDTSKLSHVLKVDVEEKTAIVEPNVPMDRLTEVTLEFGLIPQVVMEFPGITVGGGFSGTAGESSSFRYGLFEHTVNWVEVVLPNGEIVTASKTEHADLFCGAASAFGTLGVVTLLEVQLIDSKSYVELTYLQVSNIDATVQTL